MAKFYGAVWMVSHLNAHLTDLMTAKRRFSLTEAAIKSFEKLKQCLSDAPVLCSPDFLKPFGIPCDANRPSLELC